MVAHTCNPSTLGAETGGSLEVKISRQDWAHGEAPSLLKIQKLAGPGDACLQSQLLGRLRQENCLNLGGGSCSDPRSCHCTPGWVTVRLCLRNIYFSLIFSLIGSHSVTQAGVEWYTAHCHLEPLGSASPLASAS